MSRSIIMLGMDVHKDSITLAVLPDGAPAPTRLDRLPNDLAKLHRYCDRLAEEGELRACYEASGAGYVLHRAMREWGYTCDVIAPSLIPTKPGVQRKHDKHDAAQLARLHGAGELTAVRIPSEAEERVRDVVRCRPRTGTRCRSSAGRAIWRAPLDTTAATRSTPASASNAICSAPRPGAWEMR
jgi:transposase